jgi:hypothetical protein
MPTLNDAFERLVTSSGLTNAKFERRSKVKQQNISAYRGGQRIGCAALLKACENFYGWPIQTLSEVGKFKGDSNDIAHLPTCGGIYIFYDSAGNIVYLGKAKNFRAEVRQTYRRASTFSTRLGPRLKKKAYPFGNFTKFLSLYRIDNSRIRKNFEAFLLRVIPNQSHNSNVGHFS